MPSLRYPFRANQCYIYKNGSELRITLMNTVRDPDVPVKKRPKLVEPIAPVSDSRMLASLSRSKRLINEYAANNDWDWWFTGTLNKELFPRYDLEKFHFAFTRFLRSLPYPVTFLIVPEAHKDGAVHVHGYLKGIPDTELRQFKIGDKMGKKIAQKVRNGELVYNWPKYADKFGFCDLESIRTIEGSSKYIIKYITKELCSLTPPGKQCFWHSRGLQKATLLCKGTVYEELPLLGTKWYKAEHCRIATVPYDEILLNTLEGYLL